MVKNRILRACFVFASVFACINASAGDPLKGATAISEIFGDGAKVTTAILQYDESIDGESLSIGSFAAEGREIIDVYTSMTDDKGAKSASGNYVVIALKSETVLQPVRKQETQGKIQGPVAGQRRMGGKDKPANDTVAITQLLTIKTVKGKKIKASGTPVIARTTRTLVADDFKQLSFQDAETGIELGYNLFVPKDMEPGKKYPMVLFIHDASGAGKAIRNPLLQGNGATIWATPESQAKHPCFVVAPQFAQVTVDDDFNTTDDLTACINLIDALIKEYNIDADRVYTTGQSMGCMSSYVLMLRRPDLFASAMLVAGQWNPEVMAPLAKKNLWLLSCKGDVKSSEGVAAAIEVWKQNGATVIEQEWPLDTTAEARAKEVNGMLRRGGNIHYTHFAGGSHNNTWRKAYYIDGVRDWLFAQHRPLPADSLNRLLRNLNDNTVFVAANHGDFHGTTENSIHAVEKAIQKGATIALVDVKEEDGELLLESGERLTDALEAIGNEILLLVNPSDENVAKSIEQLAEEKNMKSQFILYGSNYGTATDYMARITVGTDTEEIDKVLDTHPIAVEINFADDNHPDLPAVIRQIKGKSRICFNMTEEGLCGSHTDTASRNSDKQKLWGGLIEMGGSIILTNQIKPLLSWLNNL